MKYKNHLLILLLSLVLISCFTTSRLVVENDDITATKRIKLQTEYAFPLERKSTFVSLNQKIVREIFADTKEKLTVYDVLQLDENSFPVSNIVYLITDTNHFKINTKSIARENSHKVVKEEEDIMTADSTNVSVITGYTPVNNKINRLVYEIDAEVLDSIKNSNELKFRYYAGSEMITVNLNNFRMNKLKSLLNQ